MKRAHHIRHHTAEHHIAAAGEATRILATALHTDGRVSVFDSELPKGHGAPWHFHDDDDELFYVISGRVEFGVDGAVSEGTPGDLVIAGPGVHRRFRALEDSHVLVINSPAGPSEGFIREITKFSPDAPPSDDDKQSFVERFGIHIV